MTNDVADKELAALRKKRWNEAFHLDNSEYIEESKTAGANRKATVVIENLIQASNVSYTMQHWRVYLKWNERLFHEMYNAYLADLAEKDPSEGWYHGEIESFDSYIIPLTRNLKDCDVFGVTSDEYLNYATDNRNEWEAVGQEIVAGYLAKYRNMGT
jgi:hypothetical protein